MNCSDISLILDDRDTGTLDDGLRKAVDTHLAACADCASDWKLHARLVTRKLPAFPSDLLDDCSALAVAGPAADRMHRNWRRAALAASVAALTAAAATLTLYSTPGRDSAQVASMPSVVAAQPDVLGAQAPVITPSVVHNAAPVSTLAVESSTFSVRISNSQDDSLEAADKTLFDTFRTAAINELRRVPGLILVLAESSLPEQTVDYEITFSAVRRNGRLNGILRVRRLAPDPVVQPIQGAFAQDCDTSCFRDAASLGEGLGRAAARMMMPPAAAERTALLGELQNVSLLPQQRLEALRDLDLRRALGRAGPRRTDPSGDSLRDPAVIRAVIDLASVTTIPAQRAEIWWTMRSIRSPALVEPLAHAAQLDPDSTVRAEAVATLVADFAGSPRARAVLEPIARTDSHPMVRALAQRGLSGEATWNRYVLSSLEDTSLSDAQRLDALLFHARSSAAPDQPLARLLDDDAVKSLAQVLARAAGAGTEISGIRTLLNHLMPIKHPAITGMLLTSIERRELRFDRRQVVNMLADRVEEPGVRAALEKIAKADPDEQSRQIARRALQEDQ